MDTFAERYHDFSYGHRICGHESKCKFAHGHNGRAHFTVEALSLDSIGRVIDFGEIGRRLCNWLEENWDHRFILWEQDPWVPTFLTMDPTIVLVDFNPTAENLARYLCRTIGPRMLQGTGAVLTEVRFEETRKCLAKYILPKMDRILMGLDEELQEKVNLL